MAIAFDAATAAIQTSGSSLTFSHTCTGSNLTMISGNTDGGAVGLTSVTYNGSAFTAVTNIQIPADRSIFMRYLIAPSTGTNNVVFTLGGSTTDWVGAVASYTGAKQSAQPDISGTNSGSGITNLTTSVTTTTDNDWLVAVGGYSNGASCTPGANTTERLDPGNSFWMGDSNAAQTPTGSYSQAFNFTSGRAAMIVAAISPALGGGGPTSNNLSLLGVGT